MKNKIVACTITAFMLLNTTAFQQARAERNKPYCPPSINNFPNRCKFSLQNLEFLGSPKEQAMCLLRPVGRKANISAERKPLTSNLERLVGTDLKINFKEKLRRHLSSISINENIVGGNLDQPLSRARDNHPDAPTAKYFVLHDTSWPAFHQRRFPISVDSDQSINALHPYDKGEKVKAHIFNNRRPIAENGAVLLGQNFAVPWRATSFELGVAAFGKQLKGLFIHVENIQPRRQDDDSRGRYNDVAPTPGLSNSQYEKLAYFYIAASARAGRWLVPAYHAIIDIGCDDGHDDPQNFELDKFDNEIGRLIAAISM